MEKKLEEIKQKVIEAFPEIAERELENCIINNPNGDDVTIQGFTCFEIDKPITLEHILEVMKKKTSITGFFVNQYGIFYKMIDEKKIKSHGCCLILEYIHYGWNLCKPLDQQSPETIDFIHKLLQ